MESRPELGCEGRHIAHRHYLLASSSSGFDIFEAESHVHSWLASNSEKSYCFSLLQCWDYSCVA